MCGLLIHMYGEKNSQKQFFGNILKTAMSHPPMSLIAPVSAIAGRKFTMKIHSESELHFLVNEVKAGLKKNGNSVRSN